MGRFVFINMPTKDVKVAREFYSAIGFEINTTFSSDTSTFVVLSDNVQLIFSTEAFLRQEGDNREFVDAFKATESSVAISMNSREEVDSLFDAAIKAGGKPFGKTVEEAEIGLYARAFSDLEGHKIDINYMPM